MASVVYGGNKYFIRDGETVLEALLRSGISVPFSCKAGVCHTCKQKAISGNIPCESQKSLRAIYKQNSFFLPCVCRPNSDIVIEDRDCAGEFLRCHVAASEISDNDLIKLVLTPHNVLKHSYVVTALEIDSGHVLDVLEDQFAESGAEELLLYVPTSNRHGVEFYSALVGSDIELTLSSRAQEPSLGITDTQHAEQPFPYPDLALWSDLDDGRLLMRVLRRFYASVYADDLLAPYFKNVTIDRIVEKQYNFLCQAITGEKVFFGERPRNGHHWMVISDEIFSHRERLMEMSLLAEGVTSGARMKILAIESRYRDDIVKAAPRPKVLFGREARRDGFDSIRLEEGTICDGCGEPVNVGDEAIYHLRTGLIYCGACRGLPENISE